MLQTAAFNDLRSYIKDRIGASEYQVDGTWYSAAIVESIVTADGIVRIKCQVAHGAACTITAVRLLNTAGEVWLLKIVNVVIDSATTNLLQWFDFNVTENEVS